MGRVKKEKERGEKKWKRMIYYSKKKNCITKID